MRPLIAPTGRRLLQTALVAGAVLLALGIVPSERWAERFAHPARVAALDGRIPEATLRGAEFFRAALVAGGVLVPTLVFVLVTLCRGCTPGDARSLWPRRRAEWWLLAASVAIGAALRLALASTSLWYDEISAFVSFAIEGPGVAFGSYAVPTNHVPMTLATWAAWTLSGGSVHELVLRTPALVAGMLAIPLAWALAGTLFGRRFAPIGAWTAALAPIAALESAEARGYAFVITASLAAALALARAQRSRAAEDYAFFALACAFAAWAHPVAILLPFAAGVIGLLIDRRLAVAALLAGVVAAVLLAPLLGDVLATRSDYARTDAGQPAVLSREGYEALVGLTLAWSDPWLRLPNLLLAALSALGAGALCTLGSARGRRVRRTLAPFALSFALAFALAALLGTWIYARFVLFALPLSLGIVSYAPAALARLRVLRGRSTAIAVTMMAAMLVGSLTALAGYTVKQPIREAVAWVDAARGPDDRVATIGLPDNAVGFYASQSGFEALPTGFLGKDLAAVLDAARPRFVIALYPDRLAPETLARLDASHDRVERLAGWADWGAGDIEIWERSAATRTQDATGDSADRPAQ